MAIRRLPLEAQTVHAELVQQLLLDQGAATPGSIVSKVIGGRTYLYAQHRVGGKTRQAYLGPDSPEVRALVARTERAWTEARGRRSERAKLVAIGRAGGLAVPTAAEAKVLSALADAGLFRLGGVLAGTHAFAVLANVLGIGVEGAHARTRDIDVVHDDRIAVALAESVPSARFAELTTDSASGVKLWPIPGFDPRQPSTSFKVHGTELHVDLLTPRRGKRTSPVTIAPLSAAAIPLPFLDYLIEETTPAAVVGGDGVLVNVPTPARFALHKLLVSAERPVHQVAKAKKDVLQASLLLEALVEDRRGDVELAWEALAARGWIRRVHRGLASLEPALAASVRALR